MSDPVAVYDYRDADGHLVFQKLRYEPKRFSQRRPLPACHRRGMEIPDGRESWVWGMGEGEYGRAASRDSYDFAHFDIDRHQMSVKLPACERMLYRLPELLAANPDHPVFVVEGEKDVETLRALGFVAVCGPHGSQSATGEWLAPLADRRCVLIPDNDHTGKAHAVEEAGLLVAGGARSVRVIWPGECGYDVGPGGDVSDWIRDRPHEVNPRDLLIALCKKFREYRVW